MKGEVRREFCAKRCCAWQGGRCLAGMGEPEELRERCLWTLDRLDATHERWRA